MPCWGGSSPLPACWSSRGFSRAWRGRTRTPTVLTSTSNARSVRRPRSSRSGATGCPSGSPMLRWPSGRRVTSQRCCRRRQVSQRLSWRSRSSGRASASTCSGVRAGGRVQVATTILKLLPMAAVHPAGTVGGAGGARPHIRAPCRRRRSATRHAGGRDDRVVCHARRRIRRDARGPRQGPGSHDSARDLRRGRPDRGGLRTR